MSIAEDSSGKRELLETRDVLHRARHLPGYIYNSPEVYELEKEKIFMRDWLAMGRVDEIKKPRRLHDVPGSR